MGFRQAVCHRGVTSDSLQQHVTTFVTVPTVALTLSVAQLVSVLPTFCIHQPYTEACKHNLPSQQLSMQTAIPSYHLQIPVMLFERQRLSKPQNVI